MDCVRIVFSPCPDAAPKAELEALAAIYRFVIDCHAKKEGATNDAAVIRHKVEVSHVEQRPY